MNGSPRRRVGRVRAHDLRNQYARLPSGPDLATVVIEDPYGPPADAAASRDGVTWTPPPRPRIVVVRTFRHDPLGRMHARGQLSEAEYLAGRAYQTLAETAAGGSGAGVWEYTGKAAPAARAGPVTDAMLRADRRIRAVDGRLRSQYGTIGVAVVRGVLLRHREIGRLSDGVASPRFFGLLLRVCLDEMAVLLGMATKGA